MPDILELAAILKDPEARSYKKRDALRDLGREAGDQLLRLVQPALRDDDRYVREDAAKLLGESGSNEAVPALIEALQDEDYYVRGAVIKALHEMKDPRAIPALKPLLDDSSYSIRDAAGRALEDLEQAAPPAPQTEAEAPRTPAEPAAEPATDNEPPPQDEPPPIPKPETTAPAAEAEPEAPAEPEEASTPEAEKTAPDATAETQAAEDEPQPPAIPDAAKNEDDAEPTGEQAESPPEAEPAPAAQEPPPELDWANTPRFHAFFGPDLNDVKAVYGEYREARAQLPKQQYMSLQAVNELRLLHADKDDDVEALEEEISNASEALQQKKHALEKSAQQARRLRQQLNSGMTQILGAFMPDTQTQIRQRLAEIDAKRRKLKQEVNEGAQAMRKLILTRKALQEEIGEQEQETAGSEQAARERENVLAEANREINNRILQRLREVSDDERETVLTELGRLGGDVEFLQFCKQEIQREMEAINENRALLEPARESLAACRDACSNQSHALGAAIGDGFAVRETTEDVHVNLNASLHFEEEKSFWGGFSNAGGDAQGRGTAKGRYTIQQLSWDPADGLTAAVNHYTAAWEELGQATAKVEFLQSLEQAAQLSLMEYCRFLRVELEKDFTEGRA